MGVAQGGKDTQRDGGDDRLTSRLKVPSSSTNHMVMVGIVSAYLVPSLGREQASGRTVQSSLGSDCRNERIFE